MAKTEDWSEKLGDTSPEYVVKPEDGYREADVKGFYLETKLRTEFSSTKEPSREAWFLHVCKAGDFGKAPSDGRDEDEIFTVRIGGDKFVTQDYAREIHEYAKEQLMSGTHGKNLVSLINFRVMADTEEHVDNLKQ